ncbi:hypothetical protein [Gemella sp. zg-1178]|uniref:hypothetical protein n=1 Tax=Gemella sp. zg-1178 TaxID=2840372 RepID=UPI00207B2D96|nr:hypothetical protein [Gemella sp. zg-1178]
MYNKKLISFLAVAGLVVTGCYSQSSNQKTTTLVKEVKTITSEDFTKALTDTSYQLVYTR